MNNKSSFNQNTVNALYNKAFILNCGHASGSSGFYLDDEEALALIATANSISLLLNKIMQQRSMFLGCEAKSGASFSEPRPLQPPVPLRESVTHDYIVCFEDGARVKSLKSYLRRFDLTPDRYRMRWGLPVDYPMVAPALSEKRASVARKNKPHLSRRAMHGAMGR